MTGQDRRRVASPVRLTLAAELGDCLDGAWWPYTTSVARELPQLIDALGDRLGEIVDIGVNWSSLEGVPDLNPYARPGFAVLPGQQARHHRVITVTGSRAKANLLVVPARTGRALAVMVLRRSAALPVMTLHLDTPACKTADDIIRSARSEAAQRALAAANKSEAPVASPR